MIIHSPIISGSLTFADGATFTLPDNGQYSGSFSGSAQFSTIGSDLIPDTSGAYDLGSEAYPFQDLWLVGNTANIGGISLGVSAGGLNIKNKSTGNAAPIAASTITIGGILGGVGTKSFKLNNDGEIEAQDENGAATAVVASSLIVSSSNGAVTMSVDTNGEVVTTTSAGGQASSNISGSFTGSVQDLVGNGNATFNDAVTVSGLSSLDGGIDVDGVFTVADSTGNVATTGTLSAGATTVTGLTANGSISGSGTLSAGATTLTSTVDVTGLASLDGGIDVDGAFTVGDTNGNVVTTGTITVPEGNLTIGSTAVDATASELNLLDGSTAGTVTNSKAVVYGSGGEVNATKLQVGGVDITATPAELNLLDGVAGLVQSDFTKLAAIEVTATKINYLTDMTGNVKEYIDNEVAGIVDSAPGTLDTLNELAAALGDDANFSTTISNTIGGKVSQSLQVIAGDGLTGGGNLTTDRTLNVGGTANRISVSADAVDIASTYVGQTSITTLGTIATGVWQGTTIASEYLDADPLPVGSVSGSSQIVLQDANKTGFTGASSITTLGTITTGTWNGTAIAHDYIGLDAIDGTNISDDAIDSEHYVEGSIDNIHLAGSIAASKITEISNLTAAEGEQLENIGTTTISATQWGYLGGMNQDVTTSSNVTFGNVNGATGTFTGDVIAYASSDERLKDNIQVISEPLQKISELRGVKWEWNDNADAIQKQLPTVGVIAQDVEKVLPELVHTKSDGYKAVDYPKLVALLIECVKEQQKEIDGLHASHQEQNNSNSDILNGILSDINQLKDDLNDLKSK